MTDFTKEVIEIIRSIPKGYVMTYGQIATQAGNPWGSRQVSRILHSMSQAYQLPWHRVVNSKGSISLTGEGGFIQAKKLSDEGVEVRNGKIDLDIYLFQYTNGGQ